MNRTHRITFQLAPSAAQRRVLDDFFVAPLLVARLLRQAQQPVVSLDDAALFLMRHKRSIDAILLNQDRPVIMALLKALVLAWGHAPKAVRCALCFKAGWSLDRDQRVHLPIAGLGPTRIKPTVAASRSDGPLRLAPDCSVRCEEGVYDLTVHAAAPAPQTDVRVARLRGADALACLRQAQWDEERRLSRAFGTIRFHDLSGRAVQGGLPSLGKRA